MITTIPSYLDIFIQDLELYDALLEEHEKEVYSEIFESDI